MTYYLFSISLVKIFTYWISWILDTSNLLSLSNLRFCSLSSSFFFFLDLLMPKKLKAELLISLETFWEEAEAVYVVSLKNGCTYSFILLIERTKKKVKSSIGDSIIYRSYNNDLFCMSWGVERLWNSSDMSISFA